MANTAINTCLQEVLTDENGKVITPTCGMEKLLCLICENLSGSADVDIITTAEIDEIMS